MSAPYFYKLCQRATVPSCNIVNQNDAFYFPQKQQIQHQLEQHQFSSTVATAAIIPLTSKCYSRSIDVANTIIFQPGTFFIHLGTIIMLVVILFNIKSNFTAIGRYEMLYFYWCYFILSVLSIINDCGVIPPDRVGLYVWSVAAQCGLTSVCCWALMVNGLLGFELWEDGKTRSIIGLHFTSVLWFSLTFSISMLTLSDEKEWGRPSFKQSIILFSVLYVLNTVFVFVYAVSQLLLCLYILQRNVWAMGSLLLALFFFVTGQVIVYGFSNAICDKMNHYLDGSFFGTLANTFAVMMVYKYWGIITAEDLEFSVSNEQSRICLHSEKIDLTKGDGTFALK